ncbi:MAG TPA: hypothetical protein PKN49_11545 [Candidatus Aminicenantes bacterium]|nr:hypothetical protein [Candidatus Aminicenantes bacterium]
MKEQNPRVNLPGKAGFSKKTLPMQRMQGSPVATRKKRVIGRPFRPGPDPRRHKGGRKCATALEFSQAFNRALAEGGSPEDLAALIWEEAMKGSNYARDVILDRLLGPVTKTALVSNIPVLFGIEYKPDPEADSILIVPPSNVPGRKLAEG